MLLIATSACEVVDVKEKEYPAKDIVPPDTLRIEYEDILYSAVSFPEGYDWVSDLQQGEIDCRLLLMTEDSVLIDRPVGEEYETSPDPDMHRIADSALYEDWSSDNKTRIRKNGEVVMEFGGREMLMDLIYNKGAIYTLGAPRNGGGFILRKDGQTIAQSADILPMTELYFDEGDLCFTGVSRDGQGKAKLFNVVNGKTLEVVNTAEKAIINQSRMVAGKRALLFSVMGSGFIAYEQDYCIVGESIFEETTPMDMMYDGGRLYFDYQTVKDGEEVKYSLKWMDTESREIHLAAEVEGGFDKVAYAIEGNDLCILGYDENKQLILLRDGELTPLPQGARLIGKSAVLLNNAALTIALVDENNDAILWKDGIVKYPGIHGYIDHASVGKLTRLVISTDRH